MNYDFSSEFIVWNNCMAAVNLNTFLMSVKHEREYDFLSESVLRGHCLHYVFRKVFFGNMAFINNI